MMETPRAVLNAEAIAGSSPRVACFVMGTSDLVNDLHAQHTRDRLPVVTSLGLCILAARAFGLAILDGVHLDLDDMAGFEAASPRRHENGLRRQDPDPSQDPLEIANRALPRARGPRTWPWARSASSPPMARRWRGRARASLVPRRQA